MCKQLYYLYLFFWGEGGILEQPVFLNNISNYFYDASKWSIRFYKVALSSFFFLRLTFLLGEGVLAISLVMICKFLFLLCFFFLLFFSYLLLSIPVWCSRFLVIWFWQGFNLFSVTNLFFSVCSVLI